MVRDQGVDQGEPGGRGERWYEENAFVTKWCKWQSKMEKVDLWLSRGQPGISLKHGHKTDLCVCVCVVNRKGGQWPHIHVLDVEGANCMAGSGWCGVLKWLFLVRVFCLVSVIWLIDWLNGFYGALFCTILADGAEVLGSSSESPAGQRWPTL
jgi:hypothetical protein